MTRQTKSKLTFIFATLFVVGFTISGCNNGETTKVETKEVKDTTKLKGNDKPTPEKPPAPPPQ